MAETLDHDGYDSDGPESDLWDLYIFFIDEKGDVKVDFYHWENWFTKDTVKKYNLWSTYDMDNFKYRDCIASRKHREICTKLGF